MVKETHIVFSPSDVSRIRFQCTHCGGEVTQGLEDTTEMPTHCPMCQRQWRSLSNQPSLLNELRHILREIAGQERQSSEHNKVRVRLELNGEDA